MLPDLDILQNLLHIQKNSPFDFLNDSLKSWSALRGFVQSLSSWTMHPPSPAKCFQSALPFVFYQPHQNQVRQRKKWERISNCKTKEVSNPFEQPRGGCVEALSSPCWVQVMVLLFGPEHSWLSEVAGQISVSTVCQPAGAVPKQLLKLLCSQRA